MFKKMKKSWFSSNTIRHERSGYSILLGGKVFRTYFCLKLKYESRTSSLILMYPISRPYKNTILKNDVRSFDKLLFRVGPGTEVCLRTSKLHREINEISTETLIIQHGRRRITTGRVVHDNRPFSRWPLKRPFFVHIFYSNKRLMVCAHNHTVNVNCSKQKT